MKLEIKDTNYTAVVIKLPEKHKVTGLDNLVRVNIFGNDCLIGKDSLEGLYVYFPAECQLSEEFCSYNNLFRHNELNREKDKKGFFEDTKRVKSLKFKGIVSTCFLIPVESLSYIKGWDTLKIGDEFNSLDGVEICKKYTIWTKEGKGYRTEPGLNKIVERKFIKELQDTEQLLRNIDKLALDDTILISTKVHGTSVIFGNTYIPNRINWFKKAISKVFQIQLPSLRSGFVVSSRRVIKSLEGNTLDNKAHWYESGDIWTKVCSKWKDVLPKNYVFYGEIIGFEPGSSKEIQKGYNYGIEEGFSELLIYKVTKIDEFGHEFDLFWPQIQTLCKNIGLKTVNSIYYGSVRDYMRVKDLNEENWRRDFTTILKNLYLDIPETFKFSDKWNNISEGICIRVDKYPKIETFKYKSPLFILGESKELDTGKEDIESQQTEEVNEEV